MAVALDIDPFDEAVLADLVPTHALIREHAPVVEIPSRRILMTGRDALVREILSDPDRFSSAAGVGLVDIRRAETFQRPSVILEVDPPEHGITRRVLNRILSPSAMRRLRDQFERTAAEMVADIVARRDVDLAVDLAFRFPFTVLPDAVGMQSDGRDHLLTYSSMYFNNRVPGTRLAIESARAADEAGSLAWVREQCRREHLGHDGFGAAIYAAADAGEIDDDTAGSLVRTFLSGGIDTTVLVLGSLFHAVATHPDQWAMLRAEPGLSRAAFDEALRLAPGAPIVGRTTTEAVELDGVRVDADRRIVCSVLAANRDPRRWDDPDRFDLTRTTAGQLGFGLGPHFCVGHAIARLEADCVIAALAERVERIELVGPPVPEVNNWLFGIRRLPCRLVPV